MSKKIKKGIFMNTLENFNQAQQAYLRLKKIEKQLIHSRVQDYQISELVKQCSEAKAYRNRIALKVLNGPLIGTLTLAGFIAIPYLTLIAF